VANESSFREAMKAAGLEPGVDLVEREPDQPDLLGDDAEAEAGASADQFGQLATVRGRGGRPKDARNLATRETVRLIQATRRDPLMFLADVVAMRPSEVRQLYGCEGAQALGHQVRAASELSGYMHHKAPTAVRLSGDGFVGVMTNLGGAGDARPDQVGGQTVEHEGRTLTVSSTYE
jgi:hypothetical protein